MAAALSLSDIHPDFVSALIVNAEAEADGVILLLQEWGFKPHSDTGEAIPWQFSREFLLGINVGVRFTLWEANENLFHLHAGLPNGKDVISGTELQEMAESLNRASLQLFHKHFVWRAKSKLQIDLGVQGQLDDEQLDALADFLWDKSHALGKGRRMGSAISCRTES